jgi:dTDP-4-amino-4,6-dideoxygalactose transaminase
VADSLAEILANGRITNFGKYNAAFEEAAWAYLGVPVAAVSSGTAAAILTMKALELQAGRKVIVPSFTFMASAQAILYAGCVPVFAEVRDDLTLCPDDLDRLLTKHHSDVEAVFGVHTFGMPAQVDALEEVVRRHAARGGKRIRLLYDAAHAFGSAVGGRRVGQFGDAEVFSMSVTKVLVSVEGGLVASKDAETLRRVRKLRNYGIEENYDARWQGLNGKMSEFHAIVGLYNVRRMDELMAARQERALYYCRVLRDRVRSSLLPWSEGVVHTFKDFSIVVPEDLVAKRDAIMAAMKERGVETRAYFYPPVHEQQMFRRFADRPLPKTEDLARRVITLPFYTTISEEEMDYVADALAEAERGAA